MACPNRFFLKKNSNHLIQSGAGDGLFVYPQTTHTMKFSNKLIIAATISTIGISSFVRAEKEDALVDPVPVTEEPADSGSVVEGPEDNTIQITLEDGGSVEGGEVVELTVVDDGATVDKDASGGKPDDSVVDAGSEEPVRNLEDSEVQRGEDRGLDPDVIFQTTALDGDGGGAADRTNLSAGSDERAAQIENKSTGMSAVKNQKKGPVALVKKGRVFLR